MANRMIERTIEKRFKCKVIYREPKHNKRVRVNGKYTQGIKYLVYTNTDCVFEIYPKREFKNRYFPAHTPYIALKIRESYFGQNKNLLKPFILEAKSYIDRKNKNEK